jgi:hypothetical protein
VYKIKIFVLLLTVPGGAETNKQITSALSPTVELGAQWPPIGIEAINPLIKGNGSIVLLALSVMPVTRNCANGNALNPYWVSGFSDAESSFMIMIRKKSDLKLKWAVDPAFTISINQKDLNILKSLQTFFGAGSIRFNKKDSCYQYSVFGIKDLTNKIIPHFIKYPLITHKQSDFFLFKSVVELINAGEHRTPSGLIQIASIKAYLNRGLSESLKKAFPNLNPFARPSLQVDKIQDPNWLAGFVEGDGSFYITITESKSNISGYNIRLLFSIGQHSRDFELLSSFTEYLNCGFVMLNAKGPNCSYAVTKFEDQLHKIIPFFKKYSLVGKKKQDFLDWCRIAKLMTDKAHHTPSGISLIKEIRTGMNRRRS